MAYTIAELRALSEADLVREHDRIAQTTVLGLNYFRDELNRREQDKQTRIMVRLTWVITWLTALILVLTVLSLVVVWRAAPAQALPVRGTVSPARPASPAVRQSPRLAGLMSDARQAIEPEAAFVDSDLGWRERALRPYLLVRLAVDWR